MEGKMGCLFWGRYDHILDAKGRIVIPAAFRRQLGDDFVITKGRQNCLTIQTTEAFAGIINDCESGGIDLVYDDVASSVKRVLCENAYTISADRQGRTIIPQVLRDKVGMGKEIVTVGSGSIIEVWSRDEFERVSADDHRNFGQSLTKLRKSKEAGEKGSGDR
jgi:MraZ protein